VLKAAPSHGKPMNIISNVEKMNVEILGRIKDFEQRAMQELTKCLQ
jgi:hypothetical protein